MMAKSTTTSSKDKSAVEKTDEAAAKAEKSTPAPAMEPAAVVPAASEGLEQGGPTAPPTVGPHLEVEAQGISNASIVPVSVPPQPPAAAGFQNIMLTDCYGTLDFYDARGTPVSIACRTPVTVTDIVYSTLEKMNVNFRKV
jgi:hypothetical protein